MKKLIFTLLLFSTSSFAVPLEAVFGNSLIGDNSGVMTADKIRLSAFELTEDAYMKRARVYVESGGDNQPIRVAMYTDNNGLPGTIVATTQEYIVWANSGNYWTTLQMVTNPLLTRGKYWVGVISGFSASPARYRFFTNPGKTRIITTDAYIDGPQLSFSQFETIMEGSISAYVIYQTEPLVVACDTPSCVKLTWLKSDGATSYVVHYSQISNAYDTTYETSDTDTVTIRGLLPSTQYCFAVSAKNEVSESALSNEICAVTRSDSKLLEMSFK